ncbi:MAG: hypothetical protein Q8N37_00395 [bacterium]|nr:hypothetical protein [bacterium]
MSDEKEIKKPIDPEKEKAGEIRGEAPEKEPKTLEEEIKRDAVEIENAKAAITEQQEKDEKTLAINDADESNKEEFNNGKKVIGEKVKAAEGEYGEEVNKIRGDVANKIIYNDNNMENKEGASQNLSKEEIGVKVTKINEQLDSARLSPRQITELKKEREVLLNMLPEYQGDWGKGPGAENEITDLDDNKTIKSTDRESKTKEEPKEFKQTTLDKIEKLMRDPSSELFIINKAVNFEEEKIPKLEFELADTESSKNNIQKEERIKFTKANIREHKKILENLKIKVKEILNKLETED